jgi:hypothetical protein
MHQATLLPKSFEFLIETPIYGVVVGVGLAAPAGGVVVVPPGAPAGGVVVVPPGAPAGGVAASVGSPPPAGVVVVPAGSLVPPSQAPRAVARPNIRAIPKILNFITPLSPIATRTIFCLLTTIPYLLGFFKRLHITDLNSIFVGSAVWVKYHPKR